MKFLATQMMLLGMFRSTVSRSSNYIDPLAGSVIVQVILGGAAGVGVVMKMYWHRVTAFLGRNKSDSTSD